jgi:O-antigen/teichoic acid export membrane protein
MQHFSRVVARNSAFGMAAQLLIKVLSFAFSVLIVRELGAEDFGQYAAVAAFGSIFLFIGDLGLSPYTVREVARLRDSENGAERIQRLYGDVLLMRIVLSTIGVSCMLVAAWATDRPLVMIGALALNAIGMVLYGIQGTSEALLAGHERLDLTAGAKVLYQVTFVTLGGLALWFGLGYYGLIGATLVAIVLLTAVSWLAVACLGVRPLRGFVQNWRLLLRASIPFGIIGFTLGLSYKFDSVLLNIFRGDAETGFYNAAYNLVFSTAILSNVINTALYPSLTRQAAVAPHTLPPIYARALGYLLLLALPIAFGASVLAHQIVPFLFTEAYLPAVSALQIVIWVVPFMFASEFLGYVVLIAGQEKRVARAVLISTGLNVALNLLLVPLVGFFAAAALTVVTEIVLVAQYGWMLRAEFRGLNWSRILLRPLLASAVMGGLAFALQDLPLLLNIALSGTVYAILLMLFGVVGIAEWRFLRTMRRGTVVPEQEGASL